MEDRIKAIVKFKNVEVSSKADFIHGLNATITNTLNSINAMTITIPKDKIGLLKMDSDVEYVEISTDKDVHILGFAVPQTTAQLREIALIKSGQVVPWGISKIRARTVHADGNKGTGIKVCIIDTGIDYNHPDLMDNYKGGYDFINRTTNPKDQHGHGTHVAGTIAATDDDVGVIGVAPEAFIYAYRVLDANGNGSYDNIVAAIQRAIDEKMQIVSMSLGGGSYSQALKDICDAAYNSGIIIVAAAGNSDGDGSQNTVAYPARFNSVIAVASTDSNDNRSSFSSCGPEVEVAAPGSNVISTVPTSGTIISDPSGYKSLNGTSMATPHVSGVVALMLKSNLDLTPVDVRAILGTTSVDLGLNGRDIFFGSGRIDAKAATNNENPLPPPPLKKYRCTGSPSYQCIEDPDGQYSSIEECQAACKAPTPTRYNCLNGVCVPSSTGKYPDLESCQAVCKQLKNKYIVNPLGNQGAVVIKNLFGSLTADEAITEVTRIIKELDSK